MRTSAFDYVTPARAAGLTDSQIGLLVVRWREEYGDDQHLLELRLLRVCTALLTGKVTLAEAIGADSPQGQVVAEDDGDFHAGGGDIGGEPQRHSPV